MEQILKYPGAKTRLAPWLLSFVPEHNVYLEPFFGSGALFFNKQPSKIETINDIDGEVCNLFRVIRQQAEELAKLVEMTPYSREEYERAFIVQESDDEVEKARKFLTRCWQGMGSSNVYKNGFRSSQQSGSPRTTKHWAEVPDRILQAAERLKMAQIESLDAVELMGRYDTPDVFIYLDPPYLPGIRKGYLYKHEMKEEDHRRLLLAAVKHPGKILISGYDSALYNEILNGWNKEKREAQAEGGAKRIETVWYNYDLSYQMKLKIAEGKG